MSINLNDSSQRLLIQPFLIVPLSKQQEIASDIHANLFQVPDEDQIIDDLEDRQKAQDLDEQWKEVKRAQQIQEALITRKKIQKIDQEQHRLANRLEELVSQPQFDDADAKYKLIALKRRIEQDHIVEREKLQEQYLIKKEHELEMVVRKKIEVEQILEKKKKINEQLLRLEAELSTIDEVKNEQDMRNMQVVERALKRQGVDVNVSDRDKLLLADNVFEYRVQESNQELMFQEIQDRIEVKRKQAQEESQAKYLKLNLLKSTIREKQSRVLMEKAVHGEIMRKGIDLLVDVELGKTLNMEQLRSNVQVDEQILEGYRQKGQQARGASMILETGKKLSALREQLSNTKQSLMPYRGELKPFLNNCKPNSLLLARRAAEMIVESAMRRIMEQENVIQQYKLIKSDVEAREQHFVEMKERTADKALFAAVCDEMFNRVVLKVIREAATEITTLNSLASSFALNIIINSLQTERKTTNTIPRLQKLYADLRDQETNLQRDVKVQFNYQSQAEIDWKKVKKGKRNLNKQEAQKLILEKSKKQTKKETKKEEKKEEKKVEADDEDEDDDYDVQPLEYKKECLESLGVERIRDYEIFYWEKISFTDIILYKEHIAQNKSSVSLLKLSPYQDYILIGMDSGEVYIYDAYSEPNALCGVILGTQTKSPVHEIQFGLDNVSNIAITNGQGLVQVCQISFNHKPPADNDIFKGLEKLGIFQPMFYINTIQFNYKYLLKNKEEKTDPTQFNISYAFIHPAFTLSCLQPYYMLGSHNGTLIKFNSNKDIYANKQFKFPIHQTINSTIIVGEDVQFAPDNSKLLNVQENDANTSNSKIPHVFREFFRGHKSRIIFITFLGEPESIITVDSEGHIYFWDYQMNTYQIRSKQFKAKLKYKLNLDASFYEPASQTRKNVFPDPSIKNQTPDILAQKGVELYKEYFNNPLFKTIFEKDLPKQGFSEAIVILKETNPDKETLEFNIITVQRGQQKITEIVNQEYKLNHLQAQAVLVKSSLSNAFLYIEVIRPHQFNTELVKVEIVGINTNGFRLKKLCPSIEASNTEKIDFEVLDNFYPFMTSFIALNMPQGIVIMSLATGSILKVIQDHFELVKGIIKKPISNGIQFLDNEIMFITFQKLNGIWKCKIVDSNVEDEQNLIYENARFEYEKLFRQ